MIITCPGCHTRFQIAPASLGNSGRTVRCSSCGERWFVEPFTTLPPPPPPLAIPSEGTAETRPPPERAGQRGRLVAVLVAILVVLLAAAALAARNGIAARLPAMAPIYQRLGLALELPLGVELRAVRTAERTHDGRAVLVVSGEISNMSGHRREIPPIRVALLDADRHELEVGQFDPPEPVLGPGGVSRFEVQMPPPASAASDVAVSFVTAD